MRRLPRRLPLQPHRWRNEAAVPPFDRWNETTLERLTDLDRASYDELVVGSPLKRATREGLARNAITVLANRREPRYRKVLEKAAREHPDPAVREHAAWGLTLLDEAGE